MAAAIRVPGPLQVPAFRRFWLSTQTSNAGTWLQQVAAAWAVYAATGSPAWTGAVTLAQRAPGLVLTPWAGRLADRHDRRAVIAGTAALQLVAAGALALASLAGRATPTTIIALAVLGGAGQVLSWPAALATVTGLVPRGQVQAAVSLNSAGFNVSRIVGPALAGTLLVVAGPTACFALNALSFLPLLLVARTMPRASAGARVEGAQLRVALAFARSSPPLRRLLAGTAVFVFLASPLTTLAPVFARAVGSGPDGLGLLLAAFGAGAVAGAPLGVRLVRLHGRGTVVPVATLCFCALSLALAAAPNLVVAALISPFAGAAWLVFFTTTNAGVQLLAPDELRGRVLSLYLWLFATAMGGSAIALGALAGAVGIRATLIAASLPLAGWALAALLRPVEGMGPAAAGCAVR